MVRRGADGTAVGPDTVNDDVIDDNEDVGDEDVDAVVAVTAAVAAVALFPGAGRDTRPGRVYS